MEKGCHRENLTKGRKKLRQQLLELTLPHRRHLSQQLFDSQADDAFIQTDLHRWKNTLDDLKANLISPSMST
jgi:hypothetical protein